MTHPTVDLPYVLGEIVPIDEEIAPLIRSIWQLGIRTTSSCQGDPGGAPAHLILSTEDLIRLLNLISSLAPSDDADQDDEEGLSSLFYRIAPSELVTHEHPGRWSYETGIYREHPGNFIRAETLVEFPHEDIAVITEILARAVMYQRGDDPDHD